MSEFLTLSQRLSPVIIWRKLILGNSVSISICSSVLFLSWQTVFISRVTVLLLVTPSRIAFETVYFPSKVNWLKYKILPSIYCTINIF